MRLSLEGAFETAVSHLRAVAPSMYQAPLWRRLLPTGALSVLVAVWPAQRSGCLIRPGPGAVTSFELTTSPDAALNVRLACRFGLAPDGTVVYVQLPRLFLRRSADLNPVPIRGSGRTGLFCSALFSPDGTSVGFFEGFTTLLVEARTGPRRTSTTITQLPVAPFERAGEPATRLFSGPARACFA